MPKPSSPLQRPSLERAGAFTVVELLVVIAVVAVLAVLLFVTGGIMLQKSRTARCIQNLRQMNTASIAFSMDNHGKWPNNTVAKAPNRFYFFMEILPYTGITEEDLTKNFNTIFVCPADREGEKGFKGVYAVGSWRLSYAQNGYLSGTLTPDDDNAYSAGSNRATVQLPNELMTYMDFEGHWTISTSTMDSAGREEALRFRHNGFVNAAFADGHVAPTEIDYFWGKGNKASDPFPFFQGRRK